MLNGSDDPRFRIALVHDFLLDLRGAERTFLEICDLFPQADVYTAVYDEDGTEGRFARRNVHASFLNRLRPTSRTFRTLLPLYPVAIESFDLSRYDLVISSSSAWAHGVICDNGTAHVCYCHNPFRYAWNDRERTLSDSSPLTRPLLRQLFSRWRQWDWIAAQRVDRYMANSRATQRRIASYFGRPSTVVYPPVDTGRFQPSPVGDHYLVLSELMAHKRIETAVRAFTRLGRRLVVVGDGPDARRLQRLAGPTIEFTGRVSDAQASELLSTCRALIVPAVEEFGIAAVEAQAAGRPVLALHAGGLCETVVEGVTGAFWDGGVDELIEAVRTFDVEAIDPRACVENAARFAVDGFRFAFSREVDAALRESDGDVRERRPAGAPARPWRVRMGSGSAA